MYTTDYIFPILPIKPYLNKDSEPTMPHKLATVNKPSVSKAHVLFCPFVLLNTTAHVDTKALNMRHQS